MPSNDGHPDPARPQPQKTDGPPAGLPPPGWYPDPADPSQQRLWSGVRWTGLRRQASPGAVFEYEYSSDRHPAPAAVGVRGSRSGSGATVDTGLASSVTSPPVAAPAPAVAVTAPAVAATTPVGPPTTERDECSGRPDDPEAAAFFEPAGSDPESSNGTTTMFGPETTLRDAIEPHLARLKPFAPWTAAAAALIAVGTLAAIFGTSSSPSSITGRGPVHGVVTPAPTLAPPTTLPTPAVAPPTVVPSVAPPTTAPAAAPAPVPALVPVVAPAPPAPAPPPPAPPTTSPPVTATTSPPQTRTVLNHTSGSGIDQTETFNAPANWDVYWSYDCSNVGGPGNFDYSGYLSDGSATDIYGPGQFGTGGSGVQHYHEAGTFHLVINSNCAWDIQVVG